MNSYLKYSLKLEILFVLRIEVIVNSTTCSLRLVYCLSFFPYDLQDKSWTHSQLVFFLFSLALVLRPWQTIRYVTSVIQRWRLTFNPRRWTPVDLGSILWANQRTIIYHAPDPPPLTRPCSLIFFFFFTTAFSFAIRALGIDAENFFHRVKVRKTSAKTGQEMWKRLRYTIFRLANTSPIRFIRKKH